jgi:hypothetical protein
MKELWEPLPAAENRRNYQHNNWEARCRTDGCVDIDDPHGGGIHICDLEGFIAELIALNEAAIRDFAGTVGEERWASTAELEHRKLMHEQFKVELLLRYPDTYRRVFGDGV